MSVGKVVVPDLVDIHAHVYRHVTGKFGLDTDLFSLRAGQRIDVDGPLLPQPIPMAA
jgi:dihydroorotase